MKNTQILSLVLMFLLAACEEKTNLRDKQYYNDTTQQIDTNAVIEMPSDTIFYAIKGFNKRIDNCVSDSANCATFNATFPLVEDLIHGKVSDSINNFIRKKLYKPLIGGEQANGLNSLLEPYFQAYSEALQTAQNEGEDTIAAWYFTRNFSILHNDYWLFTIKHYERSYAGGAHPNSFTNYYHFNPVNGQRLHIRNIFKTAELDKLKRMAEKKFRKKLSISPSANLEDEGLWFKDNTFSLTENFWMDDNGVHFYYNPYEVASAAVGAIKISLSYNEVDGMLLDIFDPAKRHISDKNHKPVARH